jgi:hypothetical protein
MKRWHLTYKSTQYQNPKHHQHQLISELSTSAEAHENYYVRTCTRFIWGCDGITRAAGIVIGFGVSAASLIEYLLLNFITFLINTCLALYSW